MLHCNSYDRQFGIWRLFIRFQMKNAESIKFRPIKTTEYIDYDIAENINILQIEVSIGTISFSKILVKHDDLLMAFILKLLIHFLLFFCVVGLTPAHIQCCFCSLFDLEFFLVVLKFAAIIFFTTPSNLNFYAAIFFMFSYLLY